jgi:hypothetical protein
MTKMEIDIKTKFDMNIQEYEPKFKRGFVLLIEGIDCFLVKSVKQGPVSKNGKNKLEVVLIDAIAPSTEQQVVEWFNEQKFKNTFKKFLLTKDFKLLFHGPTRQGEMLNLDITGNVVSKKKLKNMKLNSFKYSESTYESKMIKTITLYIEFEEQIVLF